MDALDIVVFCLVVAAALVLIWFGVIVWLCTRDSRPAVRKITVNTPLFPDEAEPDTRTTKEETQNQ